MAINAKKFTKLRKKLEKNLIGSYGSSRGLGMDLIIKKYTYATNNYGDKKLTFDSEQTCKGIVVNSSDFKTGEIPNLKVREGEVRLYIPVRFEVEETETIHYEFEFNANIYELVYKNDIGKVANMPLGAVVREITLKKKS